MAPTKLLAVRSKAGFIFPMLDVFSVTKQGAKITGWDEQEAPRRALLACAEASP